MGRQAVQTADQKGDEKPGLPPGRAGPADGAGPEVLGRRLVRHDAEPLRLRPEPAGREYGHPDRYEKETVPRVWLEGGEEFQFEGLRLRGPKQWDLYLARIFGDYMEMPPENERTGSHGVVVVRFAEPGEGKGQ